jgi:Tfp pilus assembly protein PilF
MSGQMASKLARLQTYLSQDPENLALLSDAASAALDEGDLTAFGSLVERYERLTALTPQMSNLKGIAAMGAHRFADAVDAFEFALSSSAHDSGLRFNLAWSKAMVGDYAGASALLDDDSIASADGALLKIRMLHHLGELDEALRVGEVLAQRFPSQRALLGALAAAALDAEDTDLAERYALAAGDTPDGLATLGLLKLNQDDPRSGAPLFQRALAIDADDARANLGLGLSFMAEGVLAQAVPHLDLAAEKFGRHLGSWVAAGWAHFAQGDLVASRARFETALAIDESFAEIHGGLAVLDIVEGDLASGERRATVAQRLDRRCLSAALARVLLLSQSGDQEGALRVRDMALNTPVAPGGRTIAQAIAGFAQRRG